ncbi:MAG: DNA repair protein RecO [Candidatus Omnitrophica bacterium]|nr:DNA repair protein RecO [Candidatus Omnitrophota bacterium]
MAIHKTEAIVLSTQNFRQTSLIANFYTRDFGKLSGLMKGVKEDPAKFNSNLDRLSLNEIIFYKKIKSTLHLVSQCDLKRDFRLIKNNLDRIKKAFSLVELVDILTVPEDKNEHVFDLALACLEQLEISSDIDKILIIFKIKLLDFCGFKPHLDSCVSCNSKIIAQAKFSLKFGGLLCERCLGKDIKSRIVFRGTVASILYIEKNEFSNVLRLGMNQAIKKELNQVLDAFLEFHLDKRLSDGKSASPTVQKEV